jgi:hypothetical protein
MDAAGIIMALNSKQHASATVKTRLVNDRFCCGAKERRRVYKLVVRWIALQRSQAVEQAVGRGLDVVLRRLERLQRAFPVEPERLYT